MQLLDRLSKGLNIRPDYLTEDWPNHPNLNQAIMSRGGWLEEQDMQRADKNRRRILRQFVALVASDTDFAYYKKFLKLGDRDQNNLYELLNNVTRYYFSDKSRFISNPELSDIIKMLEQL